MRGIRLGHHCRAAGAEDAGFLPADGFAVGPEIVDVIDADAGQHRTVGVQHVHRVQAAAKADFQDCGFNILKSPERRKSAELEIGERYIPARSFHGLESAGQHGIVGLDAGDAHALVVAHQVRRRVEAGARAARAQDRLEHRAGRALAIRAADRDHGALQPHLHPPQDVRHAVEAQRDRLGMLPLDVREPIGEASHDRLSS
jgi:hypothetical protein